VTDAKLLAVVEKSPEAIAAHDKSAWVGLFAPDGCVEDPVGSRPHLGHAQIGRFYDTFIGPRQVTFHRNYDIVSGTTVVRDVTLEVKMGAHVTMMIPIFMRYDLRQDENNWQITRLRAYWELPAMVAQFLRHRAKAIPASLQLSAALARNQRLVGTAGFVSGFRGVGRRGKRMVADALATGRLGDVQLGDKVIASGSTVAAAATTPSGRGVLIAAFDGRDIRDVDVFRSPTGQE
jgi:SnoaL-like domain